MPAKSEKLTPENAGELRLKLINAIESPTEDLSEFIAWWVENRRDGPMPDIHQLALKLNPHQLKFVFDLANTGCGLVNIHRISNQEVAPDDDP